MNKAGLIDSVSKSTGLSRKDSGIVVNAIVDSVIEGLVEDGKVSLAGFGSFVAVDRSARTARNPKTGEAIDVPAKRVPKFKSSAQLKDLLNG